MVTFSTDWPLVCLCIIILALTIGLAFSVYVFIRGVIEFFKD